MEKEFRSKSKVAKLDYKNKVEARFKGGCVREAWKGLNAMMGREQKTQNVKCADPVSFVNELNTFYGRFDTKDFRADIDALCAPLTSSPVTICEDDVVRVFSHVNPRKASGPDCVKGKVLKECAAQLSGVFTRLFQLLMDSHCVPRMWRTSTIIPLPKKPNATLLKDFRPVALTSVLCKCMERVVCSQLTTAVADRMDPLQFAYKAKRGVEDATLTLFDTILHHLDTSGSYIRVLFMDFSSAFNTIQPFLLLKQLLNLQVNTNLVLWIRAFLCDRPQRVGVRAPVMAPVSGMTTSGLSDRMVLSSGGRMILSNELVLNTGAPQGCVLSPILFSVYTNEIMINNTILKLVKYADDMALIARLKDEFSLSEYFAGVNDLVRCFDENFLELNVGKTEEMGFGGGRARDSTNILLSKPLMIRGQMVEQVANFKYLGTVIDQNLTFTDNVHYVHKKAQQRLFLLRKLRSFNVSSEILVSVYRSLIESILTFNIVSWYGNLSVKDKTRLSRVVNQASKIVGTKQIPLSELYHQSVRRKALAIVSDCDHPLYSDFQLLPSRRRYKIPLAHKTLYKRSFIPTAVKILNTEIC